MHLPPTAQISHIAQIKAARNDRLIDILIAKAHIFAWLEKLAQLQGCLRDAACFRQHAQQQLCAVAQQNALPTKPRIRIRAGWQRIGGAA